MDDLRTWTSARGPLRALAAGIALAGGLAACSGGGGSGTTEPPPAVTFDFARRTTATLGPPGGTVETTDAAGARYTLVFEPGALAAPETIALTPVSAIRDLPLGGALQAAVRIEAGTRPLVPAELTIAFPAGVPPDLVGFRMEDDGSEFALHPMATGSGGVTFHLGHFTILGVEPGSCLDVAALNAATGATSEALAQHQLAILGANIARCEELAAEEVARIVRDIHMDWYEGPTGVAHLLAEAEGDPERFLLVAIDELDAWYFSLAYNDATMGMPGGVGAPQDLDLPAPVACDHPSGLPCETLSGLAEASAYRVYQLLQGAIARADAACLASGTSDDGEAMTWIDLADALPAFGTYDFYQASGIWDVEALLAAKTCGLRELAFDPASLPLCLGATDTVTVYGLDHLGNRITLGEPPSSPFREVGFVHGSDGLTVLHLANDVLAVTAGPAAAEGGTITASIVLSGGTPAFEVSMAIEVGTVGDCTIAGTWRLTPVAQQERCRSGGDWWPEDPFGPFTITITQPLGPEEDAIEASYVPDAGLRIPGTWNAFTGELELSVDSSDPAECGYLLSDLCGDAVDCRLESCRNVTAISGTTERPVTALEADSTWYYAVTFSYDSGPGVPRGLTTWECEGSASLEGARP